MLVFPVEIRRAGGGGHLLRRAPERAGRPRAVDAHGDLRRRRGDDGVHRRGCGAHVRALPGARGLPARHHSARCSAIAAFPVLSFLSLPPVAWGLVVARHLRRAAGKTAWGRGRRRPGRPGGTAGGGVGPSRTRSWSPYYKVTLDRQDEEPGSPPEIKRQRHPAPGDPVVRAQPALRPPLRAHRARRSEGRRPDHRGRQRKRRRHRPRPGGAARGRGRDRPAAVRARTRAPPGRALLRSPRRRAHHGRAGVPRAHRQALRPHPARAARLAHARRGPVLAATRELPVHEAGDRGGARPPHPRRACSRCTTTTASSG